MSTIEYKTENEKISEEIKQESQYKDVLLESEEVVDLRDPNIIELEAQLLKSQLHENNMRDSMLRAKAETENMRRRTELDIEKAHKFALEKFSGDLLPVLDSLERAVELADKNNPELTAMLEGIELTLKSLRNVLYKYDIKIIDEINVPFNPDLHQAMNMIETKDYKPNYVIMVMQKGYMLNGRLLRPAMVTVSQLKEE